MLIAFILNFFIGNYTISTGQENISHQLQNSFIWSGTDNTGQAGYTVFRKNFETDPVQSAVLNIFADARYLLWINGKPILRGPCRFDPKGPQFDFVEVTDYLKEGKNNITVLVMSHGSNGKMMNHAPGLTVWLSLKNEATSTDILSDETWCWNNHTRYLPPAQHWGYVCDRIDARLDDGDWTLPEYDDTGWSKAVKIDGEQWGPLIPRQIPLLGEWNVPLKPLTGDAFPVETKAGGSVIIELERMAQGYAAFDFESGEGNRLVFECGYTTDSVDVTSEYKAVNHYIAKSGRQVYVTTDSYGFRYVKIATEISPVTLHAVKITDRRYPYVDAGSFTCNDPFLTDLWQRSVHTMRMNAEDGFMDCALREKAEWIGDAAVVEYPLTRVLFGIPDEQGLVKSDAGLMKNIIRHIAQSQTDSGTVKAHHPSDRWDIHAYIEDYACLWIMSLRQVFDYTGDIDFVNEIWPSVKRQLQWFLRHQTANGLVYGREFVFVDNPLSYLYCEGTTLNAFVYKAFLDAAYLANIVGDEETEKHYRETARQLFDAVNAKLWIETLNSYSSGLKSGKQMLATVHAALLAYSMELVPEARKPVIQKYILANYRNHGFQTQIKERNPVDGIYQVREEAFDLSKKTNGINFPYTAFWLLDFLFSGNHDTLALGFIRSKWADMMKNEQTKTLTESFGGGELCHNFGALPAYFLGAHVLGIKPVLPLKDKMIQIKPQLGDLLQASGAVVTEHGIVEVSWNKRGNALAFQGTIPDGILAKVYLPKLADKIVLTVNNQSLKYRVVANQIFFELTSGKFNGVASDR